MSKRDFTKVQQAIAAIAAGEMVILVDDEGRENEGDLVIAAEKITPAAINFMSRYACGLICMPIMAADFARLNIPLMVSQNRNKHMTAFGVSIGAAKDVSTGISAADRAKTVQVAVDPLSKPEDIIMPGHMFPLRAREGGVLTRRGHTEGSVDLARLAGLKPAAVICEVMNEDGTMARRAELETFAKQHELLILSVEDLVQYRLAREGSEIAVQGAEEDSIVELASANLPLDVPGEFTLKIFENRLDAAQHVALIHGALNPETATYVRLHSECFTGDVLHSARCDCGAQLASALKIISEQGGVLLYLRQEGRGIGLANKIRAYALQDQGMDTVEANQHLGFNADERDYVLAAQILKKLGLQRVKLLTNNPAKVSALENAGIQIESREAIETAPLPTNLAYLKTKRDKLGHQLNLGGEDV